MDDFIVKFGWSSDLIHGKNMLKERLDKTFIRHLALKFDLSEYAKHAPDHINVNAGPVKLSVHMNDRIHIAHAKNHRPILDWPLSSGFSLSASPDHPFRREPVISERMMTLFSNRAVPAFSVFLASYVTSWPLLTGELADRDAYLAEAEEYFKWLAKNIH